MSARTKLIMIAILGIGIVIGTVIPRETKTVTPTTSTASPQAGPATGAASEPARPGRTTPRSSRAEPIPVPSDPRASYQLVEWRTMSNGHREAMTRRDGPSGISFARREIDCQGMRFRYLGEGDTLEEARVESASPEMGDLTPESISTYVSRFVCAK